MQEEKISDNGNEYRESLLSLMKKNLTSDIKSADVYMLQVPKKTESCWTSPLTLVKEKKQDINKFRSLTEFADRINLSLKCKAVPQKRKHSNSADVPENKCKDKNSNVPANNIPSLYNEVLIEAALKRCLADKAFWSESGLISLIENCFITQRLCDTMLELILKYHFVEVFQVIKKCKLVLTSKQIVAVLKFLLSSYVKQDLTHQSKIVQDELSSVMHLDFDEVTMRSHFKSLSTNEASIFLKFLVAVLKDCSTAIKANDLIFHRHSEATVLKWIDSLLSAHLLSFIVSTTFFPMVEELRQLIVMQRRFHRDIGLLKPYFVFREKRITLAAKRKDKTYSFENILI
ncbi:uncharacterized protein LOC100199139 isoform X1 [Hydra vulgaris]|uniref:uncharacterized protein LOC100199139 isoform X1 n=1 Tax=Hydra vulgaris TaxID=6087 RepID=UPI0002B49E74|nr:uncharacterized protein LOC100199139 [Hydra vulgaris]